MAVVELEAVDHLGVLIWIILIITFILLFDHILCNLHWRLFQRNFARFDESIARKNSFLNIGNSSIFVKFHYSFSIHFLNFPLSFIDWFSIDIEGSIAATRILPIVSFVAAWTFESLFSITFSLKIFKVALEFIKSSNPYDAKPSQLIFNPISINPCISNVVDSFPMPLAIFKLSFIVIDPFESYFSFSIGETVLELSIILEFICFVYPYNWFALCKNSSELLTCW